jgi:hypothetical protein
VSLSAARRSPPLGVLAAADGAEVGHLPVQACQLEQALRHTHRLAQRQIEQPLMVRQNWIADSLYFGLWPRLPLALPCQHISLSSQISSEPPAFSAAL